MHIYIKIQKYNNMENTEIQKKRKKKKKKTRRKKMGD